MNQILVTDKLIMTPEFKRKSKIYRVNFFVSIFLACTLFSCYIYAEYDRNKSEQVSQEILSALPEEAENDKTTVSVDDDVLVIKFSDDPAEQGSEIDISDLMKQQSKGENKKNATIVESVASDGTKYYTEAILRIPSLNIEYPVLSDTSDELLKISLNKVWGPDPNEVGNYVIAGHNYKSGKMFGKLSGISIGDELEVEDLSGRKITYKVYDTYIVNPDNTQCTSQLTNGKREVTLITCRNSGKQRFIVKATEI